MRPQVSVVIPVYNGERVVAGCLEAILDQTLPREAYEVIVVDNGSTDRTAEIATRYPVRLIREPVRSPYAARNSGVYAAAGSILAFTDADCRPCREWLSAALKAFDQGADCVAGRIEHMVDDSASPWEYYNTVCFLQQQRFVSMGWAATANLLVKRDVFNRIGPFQVAESAADKEWGLRATAQDVLLRYSEEAVTRHLTRKSFREIAAKLRRDALADGRLERQQCQDDSFLRYLRTRRRPSARRTFQLYQAFLHSHLPPGSLFVLLAASPLLEWIRFSAFYRGWMNRPFSSATVSIPSSAQPEDCAPYGCQ